MKSKVDCLSNIPPPPRPKASVYQTKPLGLSTNDYQPSNQQTRPYTAKAQRPSGSFNLFASTLGDLN